MDKIQVKFYFRLHFFLKEKLSMKLFEEIDNYNTDRVHDKLRQKLVMFYSN